MWRVAGGGWRVACGVGGITRVFIISERKKLALDFFAADAMGALPNTVSLLFSFDHMFAPLRTFSSISYRFPFLLVSLPLQKSQRTPSASSSDHAGPTTVQLAAAVAEMPRSSAGRKKKRRHRSPPSPPTSLPSPSPAPPSHSGGGEGEGRARKKQKGGGVVRVGDWILVWSGVGDVLWIAKVETADVAANAYNVAYDTLGAGNRVSRYRGSDKKVTLEVI
jgi:hypothetical protein